MWEREALVVSEATCCADVAVAAEAAPPAPPPRLSSEARCRSARAAGLGFPRSLVKGARATPQNCQIPQRRRYIIHFNSLSRHHFLWSFNFLSTFIQKSALFCKEQYFDPSHQIDLRGAPHLKGDSLFFGLLSIVSTWVKGSYESSGNALLYEVWWPNLLQGVIELQTQMYEFFAWGRHTSKTYLFDTYLLEKFQNFFISR